MEETIFRWIGALGFPVVAAVAMGWVLYQLGKVMVSAHASHLAANTDEMKKQTEVLREIKEEIPKFCRADCPPERKPELRPRPA